MAASRVRRLFLWIGIPLGAVVLIGAGIVIGGRGDDEAVADTIADPQETTTTTTIGTTVSGQDRCEPGTGEPCAVDLGDELVLTTADGTTITDNGDGTATLEGTLEIDTGAGEIPIDDAELIITVPEDGGPAEIVGGTGDVPFPQIGFLEQAEIIGTSTGLFGTAYGRDIQHLGAFVNPDTKYLWVTFSDGLNVETGFDEMFPDMDTSALPESFNVPLGVSATMVIDPLDPYIYIGGACPEFKKPKQNDGDRDEDSTTTTSSTTTSTSTTTTTTLPEEPEDDAPVTVGPREAPGEDCGIGFSLNGRIPFTPSDIEGMPDSVSAYSGHIVIHGEVPLGSTGLAVDGVTIQRFETAGYRLDGIGDVLATVPFIKGLIDIEIPMGDAAAGIEVTASKAQAYAAGHFGGTQDPLVLPLPIPIEIPNEQASEIRIAASIGGETGSDGVFVVDPDSMLEIVGSQGVGASAFADLLNVELEDFQTTTGTLVIDRNGAFIEGSTNFGIHPSIDLGAGSRITAFIDAASLENSYIEAVGLMRFAAITLEGESAIRLDRDGLRAHGLLATGIGGIELDGYIGPSGLDLRGAAELSFPVGISEELASDVDDALQAAIDEVNKIDLEIERITNEIHANRRERSEDFQAAKAAVDSAQREVDKINDDIADNKDRIDELERKIDNVCAGKTGLDLTACQTVNSGKIAAWAAEIATLQVANAGLYTARTAATGVLDAAKLVLQGIEDVLDAIPVETDPRIIALNTSRDSAVAILEATRALTNAVAGGGTIGGHIDVQLGTSGLHGDAAIQWCDRDGCDSLLGAEVHFAPQFEACLELFGIPDICGRF